MLPLCLMAITVHPNVKFSSKRFLSLLVCKHRREAALSLQIDAAWRKLRSSLLALLLSINLLACASWLNDFVQKWQNLTSFPPCKLWEWRECLSLKKKIKKKPTSQRGDILSCFVLYSHIFWQETSFWTAQAWHNYYDTTVSSGEDE